MSWLSPHNNFPTSPLIFHLLILFARENDIGYEIIWPCTCVTVYFECFVHGSSENVINLGWKFYKAKCWVANFPSHKFQKNCGKKYGRAGKMSLWGWNSEAEWKMDLELFSAERKNGERVVKNFKENSFEKLKKIFDGWALKFKSELSQIFSPSESLKI